MEIEVWSDYVCPFCYIGKRRLEGALEQFAHKKEVRVVYKSYELDPNAPHDTDHSMYEILSEKYGTSIEEAKKMCDGIAEQAKTVGLDYRFESMIRTNTMDAHRLAKYANTCGKEAEMAERLLQAYFLESKHIGDHDVLVELAAEVGLDRQQVAAVLQGEQYLEEVHTDEYEASQIGVRGVPFFVINRKYAISGAQPVEVFVNALQDIWEKENKTQPLQSLNTDLDGGVCTDESCDVPKQ